MNATFVASVITGVLAVGAGVAIAGLPGDSPDGEILIVDLPSTTTTTTTIVVVADTVVPLPTTTTTTTTAPPEPVPTSIGINVAPTTIPVPQPLAPREELEVATANAAGVNGVATAVADLLLAAGYVTVSPVDSLTLADTSAVHHPPDLAAEAARLAADLGWPIDQVAPITELPELSTPGPYDLVVLIGTDRVPSPDGP